MKVVINTCYGGFSLSPDAVKAIAEKKGRACHFFKTAWEAGVTTYTPITLVEARKTFSWHAYDVEDPGKTPNSDEHYIEQRPDNRADPDLIEVVEKLGDKANGSCARLRITEIPDDVEYEIDEYDGIEHVAEKHRTWGASYV